jgi:hypothetical protein
MARPAMGANMKRTSMPVLVGLVADADDVLFFGWRYGQK